MKKFQKDRWLVFLFSAIIGINIFLLIVTIFRFELVEATGIIKIFVLFRLTGENNFAAWWTGMILFISGIISLEGHMLSRRSQPTSAKGWLLIAMLLFILSADDIMSIHERVDGLSLVPVAAILIAILCYALINLWAVEEQRANVRTLFFGFLLLGSVAVQEFLELHVDWPREMDRFRTVVEEGTELLGEIILLKVTLVNTLCLYKRKSAGKAHFFESICRFRLPILALGFVLAPILAYISANLPDQHRGHPSDWTAAALFLLAGLAAWSRFFKDRVNIGWLGWVLTSFCCLGSIISVAAHPKLIIHLGIAEMSLRLFAISVLSLSICSIWAIGGLYQKKIYVPASLVLVLLAFLSPFQSSFFFVYIATPCFGWIVFFVNSTQ